MEVALGERHHIARKFMLRITSFHTSLYSLFPSIVNATSTWFKIRDGPSGRGGCGQGRLVGKTHYFVIIDRVLINKSNVRRAQKNTTTKQSRRNVAKF